MFFQNLNKEKSKTFGSNAGLTKVAQKGLVRPSSGYYNYNANNRGGVRLTDSDTESGRYSPNVSIAFKDIEL